MAVPAGDPVAATGRVLDRLSDPGTREVEGITAAVDARLELIPATDRFDGSFVITFSFIHATGVPVVSEVVPATTVDVKTVATLCYVTISSRPVGTTTLGTTITEVRPRWSSWESTPVPTASPALSPALSTVITKLQKSSSKVPTSALPAESTPASTTLMCVPPPAQTGDTYILTPVPGMDVIMIVVRDFTTKFVTSSKVGLSGEVCRGRVSDGPGPAAAGPVATPLQGTAHGPLFGRLQTTLTMQTSTCITIFVPEGPSDPRGGPPMEGTANARTFYG